MWLKNYNFSFKIIKIHVYIDPTQRKCSRFVKIFDLQDKLKVQENFMWKICLSLYNCVIVGKKGFYNNYYFTTDVYKRQSIDDAAMSVIELLAGVLNTEHV